MCHTAKGWVAAILAAFFASLFVASLVAGYTVQTAGNMNAAIIDYFIAFILLGIAKYLVWTAMHDKPAAKRAAGNRRRR